jgi:hypothetical protein
MEINPGESGFFPRSHTVRHGYQNAGKVQLTFQLSARPRAREVHVSHAKCSTWRQGGICTVRFRFALFDFDMERRGTASTKARVDF